MALRKDTASTPVITAPFETDEDFGNDTTVDESPAAEVAAPAERPAVAAQPTVRPAAAAVALKPANAVSLALGAKTMAAQAQNAISLEQLEVLTMGTFPRVTINVAGFSTEKDKLGDKIRFELISWNYVWLIVTGEQDNLEANKLLRTSYDGVNLKEGQGLVMDYIKELKKDFPRAASKKYIELYAQIQWSAKNGDVPLEDQAIHQISLSPQTAAQWQRFLLESSMKVGRGVDDGMVIVAKGDTREHNSKEFGVATFALHKPQ
jgi:hypothetical protein